VYPQYEKIEEKQESNDDPERDKHLKKPFFVKISYGEWFFDHTHRESISREKEKNIHPDATETRERVEVLPVADEAISDMDRYDAEHRKPLELLGIIEGDESFFLRCPSQGDQEDERERQKNYHIGSHKIEGGNGIWTHNLYKCRI